MHSGGGGSFHGWGGAGSRSVSVNNYPAVINNHNGNQGNHGGEHHDHDHDHQNNNNWAPNYRPGDLWFGVGPTYVSNTNVWTPGKIKAGFCDVFISIMHCLSVTKGGASPSSLLQVAVYSESAESAVSAKAQQLLTSMEAACCMSCTACYTAALVPASSRNQRVTACVAVLQVLLAANPISVL